MPSTWWSMASAAGSGPAPGSRTISSVAGTLTLLLRKAAVRATAFPLAPGKKEGTGDHGSSAARSRREHGRFAATSSGGRIELVDIPSHRSFSSPADSIDLPADGAADQM